MNNTAIFGVPRSGTSWLGQILNSSPNVAYRFQPVFSYTFDGSIGEKSTTGEIAAFHKSLLQTNDEFVCQKKNISGNIMPEFPKREITHLVWKEVYYLNIIQNLIEQSATKVVGLIRHPCGVINSWIQAPREFNSDWDVMEEWRYANKKNTGRYAFYGFERWITATEMFLQFEEMYPDQFKIVQYEALVENPEPETASLFDYLGLEVTDQTRSFLKESTSTSSEDPYGVYRNNKEKFEWKNALPAEIIDKIIEDNRYLKIAEQVNWDIGKIIWE